MTLTTLGKNIALWSNLALCLLQDKQVAHGIGVMGTFVWTDIRAVASNPYRLTGIPIPYASASSVTDNLEIYVDGTYVYIITGGTDYSSYTKTDVILKYLKD